MEHELLQVKREELEQVVVQVTGKALEEQEKKQNENLEKALDEKLAKLKDELSPKDEKKDPNEVMGKWLQYHYWKDVRKDQIKVKTLDPQDETTAADGGYLVPTITKPEIFRLMEEYGQARGSFRPIPMGKAAVLTLPSKLTGATVSRVNEGSQIADTKVTLTTMTLTASKVAAIVAFTTEVMEDAIVDLGGYVNELLAEAFAQEEDEQMFAGTGSPHTGLFNTSATYGNTVYVADSPSITYNNLVDCAMGLKQWYLRGGEWKMHRTVAADLMKLKDDNGNPILLNAGDPMRTTLLGYPVKLIETAPNSSTATASMPLIVLGNTNKNSYFGLKRELNATILTEATVDTVNLAEYDMVGIRMTKRDAFDDGLTAAYSVIAISA